jgi:hypothetical protein
VLLAFTITTTIIFFLYYHYATMSLPALPEAVCPDITAGFTAIQPDAKQRGYAFLQRYKKRNTV